MKLYTKIKSAFFAMAVMASMLAGFVGTVNAQSQIPVLERTTEDANGKFDVFNDKMTTIRVYKVSQNCDPFRRRCVPTETEIQMVSLTDWFHWVYCETNGYDLAKGVILQPNESLKVVIAGDYGLQAFKSFYFRLGSEVGEGSTAITAQVYARLEGDSQKALANIMWLRAGNGASGVNHYQSDVPGLSFGESNDIGYQGAKPWTPMTWNDLPTSAMVFDGVSFNTTYRVYGTLPTHYRDGESSVTLVVNNPTNRRALFCGLGVAQIQQ